MDVAKNLIEYRKQFKEKEAIFDKEVRGLRNNINDCVNKIQEKFLQFKNDFLGRFGTDDFHITMRWGVEEDGVETDYVSIMVGYKDNRTIRPFPIYFRSNIQKLGAVIGLGLLSFVK